MKTTRSAALIPVALLLFACPLRSADSTAADTATPPVPPDVVASQDLNRADAVNARLVTTTVLSSIEEAAFTTRDQSIALAQQGAAEGRAITTSLRAGVRLLGDGSREEAETALIKAEQARDRLNTAITKARESTEDRWKEVREDLGERYEQYAGALEEARKLVVDGGVKFEPPGLTVPESGVAPRN